MFPLIALAAIGLGIWKYQHIKWGDLISARLSDGSTADVLVDSVSGSQITGYVYGGPKDGQTVTISRGDVTANKTPLKDRFLKW